MLENFDTDIRKAALEKGMSNLINGYNKLRWAAFQGLCYYVLSDYECYTSYKSISSIDHPNLLDKYSTANCFRTVVRCPYDHVSIGFEGCDIKYRSWQVSNEKEYSAETLVKPFEELEAYYAQVLDLLSDRNPALCGQFEGVLIDFRVKLLKLQADIAIILRYKQIYEARENGEFTLDNATAPNLLSETTVASQPPSEGIVDLEEYTDVETIVD